MNEAKRILNLFERKQTALSDRVKDMKSDINKAFYYIKFFLDGFPGRGADKREVDRLQKLRHTLEIGIKELLDGMLDVEDKITD